MAFLFKINKMRSCLLPLFFILLSPVHVHGVEFTGYYGIAATDAGVMTLDRGVVESSTSSSSFFGLRFGPEVYNGSLGIDLFYHSTTQTFSDKNSSLTSTKDFLGTYMNAYVSYDFLPKGGGEHWVRGYFGVPLFGSMKPVKSDEDHFFSPTGYSLGGEFNIWRGVYYGARYSFIEYKKYYSKGSAVSNYESNLTVSSLFTYLSYHF